MRRGIAIIAGVIVIGIAANEIFSRYLPPMPSIEPPPAMLNDDELLLDDDLLQPMPGEPTPLDRFNETPLHDTSSGHYETYRFILLPTFDHPVLVKASNPPTGPTLTTKFLDGEGGYGMGKLFKTEERKLTQDEWNAIVRSIDDSSFWWTEPIDHAELPTVDGAMWWLQGRYNGNVHSVARNSPDKKLLASCILFLNLSGHADEYKDYSQY